MSKKGCRSIYFNLFFALATMLFCPRIQALDQYALSDHLSRTTLNLRIYVAGESVEELNHMNNPVLNTDGTLFDLGVGNNTQFEYGWMFPFAQRLQIRDPDITVQWVGADCWYDHDTWECSNGIYTNPQIGHTSAISGSSIADWISARSEELTTRVHCYDVAIASRGGNDLANSIPEPTFAADLRQLINLLDAGSNCRDHPMIYVTSHMLDEAGGCGSWCADDSEVTQWMSTQESYYVTQVVNVASGLSIEFPDMNIRHIDLWSPFYEEWSTSAFPAESWWTTLNDDGSTAPYRPDISKIHRDGQHPKRLASIFVGENAADQVDIAELRSLFLTCTDAQITLADSGLDGSHEYCAIQRIALGPGLTINPGADISLMAPEIVFKTNVRFMSGSKIRIMPLLD